MILTTLVHRIIALRNENKRLRHRARELERRLADAKHCIRVQGDRNWELYQWHREHYRDVPANMLITERKDAEI